MGFGGNDTNLFRYVGNDPALGTDPSGLAVVANGPTEVPYVTDKNGIPRPYKAVTHETAKLDVTCEKGWFGGYYITYHDINIVVSAFVATKGWQWQWDLAKGYQVPIPGTDWPIPPAEIQKSIAHENDHLESWKDWYKEADQFAKNWFDIKTKFPTKPACVAALQSRLRLWVTTMPDRQKLEDSHLTQKWKGTPYWGRAGH